MRGSLPDMKSEFTDEMEWTERQDLVVQIASPEVAAEKLGRPLAAVLARRNVLGLPDPLSSRADGKAKEGLNQSTGRA